MADRSEEDISLEDPRTLKTIQYSVSKVVDGFASVVKKTPFME